MAQSAESKELSPTDTDRAPRTLLGLPKEIRLEIFDWLFYSTTIGAIREPIPEESSELTEPEGEFEDHDEVGATNDIADTDDDEDVIDSPTSWGYAGP